MKFNWNMLRLAATVAAIFAAVGCGGLNGSYNVSPATFFLPGIGQTVPASTNSPGHTVTATVAGIQ